MYKVLVTSRMFGTISDEPIKRLRSVPSEIVHSPYKGVTHSEAQMLEIIPGVDAVIMGADRITKRVIERADRLKVLSVHGVGVDQIDGDAATRKGIYVTNAPGCNTQAVADFTFGLMLAAARNIPRIDRATKEGQWKSWTGTELAGKTLGLIGMGSIGKAVARRAAGFDMTVLAYDIYQDVAFAETHGVTYVPLEDLLKTADIVSVHLSLSDKTIGLLSRDKLSLMKGSAYLINTSRGNVVDEAALVEMLRQKQIAGAAVDVYSREPPTDLDALNLPNLITTPHTAAFTHEAIDKASKISAENVARVLSGLPPLYGVNSDRLETSDKIEDEKQK